MQLSIASPPRPAAAPVSTSVDDLVDAVDTLLSLPDAAIRLNSLLTDPDVAVNEIAKVVMLDPALAARVLRAVNSPYFGLRGRVDTISKAISMIGTSELHSLVLATSAAMAFKGISSKLIDMESFWQHSVRAALAARSLAETSMRRERERVFLAGLMHDVGQLVIFHQLPREAASILQAVKSGGSQDLVEVTLLGFTHADVSAALLERWGLPRSITEPVRLHHDYAEATEFARETAILQLASRVSDYMESDESVDQSLLPGVGPDAWEQAGCPPEQLGEVIVDVSMHWLQVVEIVAPGSSLV